MSSSDAKITVVNLSENNVFEEWKELTTKKTSSVRPKVWNDDVEELYHSFETYTVWDNGRFCFPRADKVFAIRRELYESLDPETRANLCAFPVYRSDHYFMVKDLEVPDDDTLLKYMEACNWPNAIPLKSLGNPRQWKLRLGLRQRKKEMETEKRVAHLESLFASVEENGQECLAATTNHAATIDLLINRVASLEFQIATPPKRSWINLIMWSLWIVVLAAVIVKMP